MTPYPIEIPPGVELIRDVQYGEANGRALLLDLALPKTRAAGKRLPALIYLHGGAWRSGSKADGIPAICFYARHGFVAASVGYRLSHQAHFPAQIEDCKCAARFLRANAKEFGINPERIGAMGSSAGGHLAALLGVTGGRDTFASKGGWAGFSDRLRAVCSLFAPSDFLRMPRKHIPEQLSSTARLLGGTLEEVRELYLKASPVNHVHRDAPAFLLVHGGADELVPPEQSELFYEALKKAGVDATLHIVEGARHGSANVVKPEVRALILSFFEKQLAASWP